MIPSELEIGKDSTKKTWESLTKEQRNQRVAMMSSEERSSFFSFLSGKKPGEGKQKQGIKSPFWNKRFSAFELLITIISNRATQLFGVLQAVQRLFKGGGNQN